MAFQNIAKVIRGLYPKLLGLWVDIFFGGREQNIYAFFLELLYISGEGTRIFFEVLVRTKLQSIHKNRCHDWIAVFTGQTH